MTWVHCENGRFVPGGVPLEHRSGRGVHHTLLPTEYAFDDVGQVREHVKAIRNLDGQWRGAARRAASA